MKTWDEFLKDKKAVKPIPYLVLSGIECPECQHELYKSSAPSNPLIIQDLTHFYVCLHHACKFTEYK